MCENKTNCSCGCKTKKPLTEAKANYPVSGKGKYKLFCDACDSEYRSMNKDGKCPKCGDKGSLLERKDYDLNTLKKTTDKETINSFENSDYYQNPKNEKEYANQLGSYLHKRETGQIQNTEDRVDESKKFRNQVEFLQEKVNLQISSNCKRDLSRQIRSVHEGLLTIYDILERQNINQKEFEKLLDDAFSATNELLTVVVCQESIDSIKK